MSVILRAPRASLLKNARAAASALQAVTLWCLKMCAHGCSTLDAIRSWCSVKRKDHDTSPPARGPTPRPLTLGAQSSRMHPVFQRPASLRGPDRFLRRDPHCWDQTQKQPFHGGTQAGRSFPFSSSRPFRPGPVLPTA